MTITPVILCGGSGTRLWPASRDSFPKQFLSFGNTHSLFQATLMRVANREIFAEPVVITGADYRFLIADQVRQLGLAATIVLEPCRRDSAAAIAAGALIVQAAGNSDLMLVLAADHAIPDTQDFERHVRAAAPAAAGGRIVSFGVVPHRPATEYGYIQAGELLSAASPARAVSVFVEKPDPETAQRYVANGYYWNSGNFLFQPRVLLSELSAYAPDILSCVQAAVRDAVRDLDFLRLDATQFAKAPATSIDYAVMEHTTRAAVLPSTFTWSDVGGWASIQELAPKDANGNAGIGHAVFHEARNSLIHSDQMLTAVVGLDNVAVIATRDAVLVAPVDATHQIKSLVDRLKTEGRREATTHTKAFRPWGSYETLDLGERHQVKAIVVRPGGKLSLQSHMHRSEHWVVVTGTARVTVDDTVQLLTENQSIYIPLGAVHRLDNPGQIPLRLIEVQSGPYLGEDDIVRYEDVYNRAGTERG